MLNILVNIIIVVLILGVLIFIHELGHFVAARIFGIRVDAFAIGLGPKIFGWKRGGTEYQLNLFPIGGYVKILGEGDEVVNKKDRNDPRNLKNKPKIAQIAVMLAGIFMNILLAALIYLLLIAQNNNQWTLTPDFKDLDPWFGQVKTEQLGELEYEGLVEEGNAEKVGFPEDGAIETINGERIKYSHELTEVLSENAGEDISIKVCNDGCETYEIEVSEEGTIGIYLYQNYRVYISYEDTGLLSGFAHGGNMIQIIGGRFGELFSAAKESGDYSELTQSVSGPVGVYVVVDYFKAFGPEVLLGLLADFSLTLAVINSLPIPALDGGRVLLVVVEMVIRRPLNKKFEAIVINVSFLLLLLLMVAIVFKDIIYFEELRSLFK